VAILAEEFFRPESIHRLIVNVDDAICRRARGVGRFDTASERAIDWQLSSDYFAPQNLFAAQNKRRREP
jgi:hypothetical protein